jgi:small subunit ribosomal protein S6
MPKYELMYILSSAVSDVDAPPISDEVNKFLTDNQGTLLSLEMLGKKKLAYPIKKTRNGFYVLQTFEMDGAKLQSLDNKLRSIDSIIRYLVVNLDEQERRAVKDRAIQDKMKLARKPQKVETADHPAQPEVKLTDTELESKIELALESEDLAK